MITPKSNIEGFRNNVWVNPWCTAIASLIRSNHNENFIYSNVKTLALVRYITNYWTKDNFHQYQHVMGAAFIHKAYEDVAAWSGDENPAKQIGFVDVNKFALYAFNRLAYDRGIGNSLATISFLGLPEYYTPQSSLRRVNLNTLSRKIALLLFPEETNMNFSDQLPSLDQFRTFRLVCLMIISKRALN